jgi:RNA polymerase sigma factor (sigma-70 family)
MENDVPMGSVTRWLQQCRDPDEETRRQAEEKLFPLVEETLKKMARKCIKFWRDNGKAYTLEASDLVDQAFMHLVRFRSDLSFEDRQHFFNIARDQIWKLVVDHVNQRRRPEQISPEQADLLVDGGPRSPTEEPDRLVRDEALLRLHEALVELERCRPNMGDTAQPQVQSAGDGGELERCEASMCDVFKAYVFLNWQLRFSETQGFELVAQAELKVRTFEEIGKQLGISRATANRRFHDAVQFLKERLGDFTPDDFRGGGDESR